ncbi:hypothetical protein, partial [Nocardia fluminea]|uniref:hypothetical protein n=1 Tax=Nocardia fluminea TaxID=134984 RepID=UPI0033C7FD1D
RVRPVAPFDDFYSSRTAMPSGRPESLSNRPFDRRLGRGIAVAAALAAAHIDTGPPVAFGVG